MSAEFRTIDRDTPMLMPASIQEWLPEQHLARFVVDIVDQLDLSLPHRAVIGPALAWEKRRMRMYAAKGNR